MVLFGEMQQQLVLPPLVYRIRHVGTPTLPFSHAAAYGIELSNEEFGPELPKLFCDAISFMREVQNMQPYFVLKINSPGGIITTVLYPILDTLYDPTCPRFMTCANGMAASCGAVLYLAGFGSPQGMGGHVMPRGKLMIHTVQIGIGSGGGATHDAQKLRDMGEQLAVTEAELALEMNRPFISTDPPNVMLEQLPQCLYRGKMQRNRAMLFLQKDWLEGWQDVIECFRNPLNDRMDEDALYNAFGNKWPKSLKDVDNPVQNKDQPSQWRRTIQETCDVMDRGNSLRELNKYRIIEHYTAVIIDWADTQNLSGICASLKHKDKDFHQLYTCKPKIYIEEPSDDDRHPELTWVQRLLKAAERAKNENHMAWLNAADAVRNGIRCVYFRGP